MDPETFELWAAPPLGARHHRLRPAAVRQGCPPLYADPTDDPRMQQ